MGGICSKPDEVVVYANRTDPEDFKQSTVTSWKAANRYNFQTAPFENCSLPFATLRIDVYEALLKSAIKPDPDPKISKVQLKFAFQDREIFKKSLEWGTPMIILCEHFQEQGTEMIPLGKIMTLGVLLCNGTLNDKAQVLLRIIQDHGEEFVTAEDKDFKPLFYDLVNISCNLLPQLANESKFDTKKDMKAFEQLSDQLINDLREDLLNDIFGKKARLGTKNWIHNIMKEAPWLFNAEQVRQKVHDFMKDELTPQ